MKLPVRDRIDLMRSYRENGMSYKEAVKDFEERAKAPKFKKKTKLPKYDEGGQLEPYRQEFLEYINHPSYKSRLSMEIYGKDDSSLNEEQINNINNKIDNRRSAVKSVSLESDGRGGGVYHPSDHAIVSSKSSATHELQHAADIGSSENYTKRLKNHPFYRELEKLKFTPRDIEKKLDQAPIIEAIDKLKNKSSLTLQEQSKIIRLKRLLQKTENQPLIGPDGKGGRVMNREFTDLGLRRPVPREYRNYDHYARPTEIKARLNHLRIRAWREFGYDLNTPFDINDYPELKDDPQYKDLKNYIDNDEMNHILKYIAEDSSRNQNKLPVAQLGGKLPKYGKGGGDT